MSTNLGAIQDQVIDSGVMNGAVNLGDNRDAFLGALAKPADVGQFSILTELEGVRGKIACFVNGGDGSDLLYGSKYIDYFVGGSGKDVVRSAAGDDFLIGGPGSDYLSGGKGHDRFAYFSTGDSHGKSADSVADFQPKYDQFDFGVIDANTLKADDQAFHFIGQHGFSGKAGELRFEFKHGDTIILGNTDHDQHAELEIRVDGHVMMHVDDFIL